MEKTQIEKDYYVFQTNSYLNGTEDLIKSCVIAQKFIRTGDFVRGKQFLENGIYNAQYLLRKLDENLEKEFLQSMVEEELKNE